MMIRLLFETKLGDRLCALIERKLNRALDTAERWPGVRLVPLGTIQ